MHVCRFNRFLCGLVCALTCASASASALLNVLQDVLQSHPDVLSQQSSVESSKQDVSIARQQFWPTPSVSIEQAQASTQDSQYQGDASVKVLRLQQPLWTGGRLTAQLAKAEAGVQLRQAMLEESQQQLAISTVQTWGDWCASEARLAAVERSLALHQELQGKVQRRVQEGASAPAELIMTDGRVAQVGGQYQAQKAQAEMARSRLVQLLGKPLTLKRCPGWPEVLQRADVGAEQLELLVSEKHPTLSRLRAQIEQIRLEVAERRADLQPEIFIRAEHQRGNFAISGYPNTNRIFVGLNSRLGAGLSSVQQVESVRLRQQAAERELESGQRKIMEQMQMLWIQRQDVQARLPSLELQVKANWSTQEAWDRQFLAGKKSWLEVMNAARDLMQSEIELADASVNLQSLSWRLNLLVHGVNEVVGHQQ